MDHGLLRGALSLLVFGTFALATSTARGAVPGACVEGAPLDSGARTLYCVPDSGWNGDVVAYAHGYVAPGMPLDFYHLTSPDGSSLPDALQSLGYAFVTTSYSRNGLAILEGASDMRSLIDAFPLETGLVPDHVYAIGPSEGGIITALLAEDDAPAQRFDGVLSMCGPIGNFRRQMSYWGDFRVLFDYFFPGALPPSPISIPSSVMTQWDSVYAPAIAGLLQKKPLSAAQLISTSKASIDAADAAATTTKTTLGLLWYNVFATNDGIAQLGGNPFDNRSRLYVGSSNDLALNLGVQRFSASPAALANLADYETSGEPTIPIVTMHTTGDEIIPFWHESLYLSKLLSHGHFGVVQIPIARYGHCNFTSAEVSAAFELLVLEVTGAGVSEGAPPAFTIQ